MASLDPPTGDKPISILRTMTSPVANASARPSVSPLRQRPLARANTMAESSGTPTSAGLGRRRSSFMTDASVRSGTDSLFLPRVSRDAPDTEDLSDGSSHLHSIPLALALLPAIGGVFFTNGSAVLTDITLLVLAAIFLNWSVRLPWDWYHSAQSVRLRDEANDEAIEDGYFPPHAETIAEEGSQDGNENESHHTRSPISPPKPSPVLKDIEGSTGKDKVRAHKSASLELRIHELVALIACFACPVLGAWLLHHIRGSLSRPSEGLVSDYNLSIFLLASELRPLSHLLRMIQSRTLHLQRVVASNPYTTVSPAANREALNDLQTRVDELESHIASQAADGETQPKGQGQLTAEKERDLTRSIEGTLRAALQPELDAVTRATRRYEKRATLLGMQTEARLNALEQRVQDAVALAAGAERAQQQRARSGLGQLVDAAMLGVSAAADLLLALLMLPVRGAEWLLATTAAWAAWLVDATIGRVINVRLSSSSRSRSKGKKRAERSAKSGGEEWSSSGKKERKASRTAAAGAGRKE